MLFPEADKRNPKNLGRYLEYELFHSINNLGVFDQIFTERELIKMIGWKASSIDFMLVYKDHIILIQSKWKATRRRENHSVHNFLSSIEYVTQVLNKKHVFGVWITRREPFEDNKDLMNKYDVYTVSSFDTIPSLVEKAREFIVSKISFL